MDWLLSREGRNCFSSSTLCEEVMLVEQSQCVANVTEFGSQPVNIALTVVQGVFSFLSIVGSVLLILSYVLFKPLRSKSRLLITHLAVANFIDALPDFIAVFMDFRTRFRHSITSNVIVTPGLLCSGNTGLLNRTANAYCNLCVYLEFVSHIGSLSTTLWVVCVCFHFFILVSYRNTKLASHLTYVYYMIAWLAPLGISLWLLFHNWFGFEPTYSTVNCGIKTDCVPHHHPYHYQNSHGKQNWNRIIGLVFGFKIWQTLVFIIIPCLFIAIRCKSRKHHEPDYRPLSSSPIRSVERKVLLIPIIFMVMSSAAFVSDLYFFINHDKNLKNLQSSDGGITFVHFLTRIFDNSPGVINFCLFCLFTKEVRAATINGVKRLYRCQHDNGRTRIMPEISWSTYTPVTSSTRSIPAYGIINSQDGDYENPINPSSMFD